MKIDFVSPWPVYGKTTSTQLADLIASGRVYDYSGSAPVSSVEREFAEMHGGRHVVSFNSGTSALFAAFAALGVGDGDEIIVPNFTFLASASPALWLGAKPVLADSSRNDPSVDPGAIERAITPQTRVVVVTHLFGNPIDVHAVAEVCAKHSVSLVEDCSHAHASTVGESHVGTFGDAAIYSIGAGKLVSGGHGGVLITANTSVRDLALLIGHFKPRTRNDILSDQLKVYAEFALGGNLRLTPFAATLALDHLRVLEQLSKYRCRNADALDNKLHNVLIPVRSPAPRFNGSHFDLVYLLRDDLSPRYRPRLIRELNNAGVPAAAPSTRPLNRVLNSLPHSSTEVDNPLLERLLDVARTAPTDEELANSTRLHDRMISFPANRLYTDDLSVVRELGETAARVIERSLLGEP